MNKKLLLTALFCAATFAAHAQTTPPVGTATTININFTPGAATASWPYCTATVKTNCNSGTAGTILSPAGGAATPLTIAAGNTTNTAQYKPGGPLYLGTWTVTLWSIGFDSNGNTVPVCAATPVPPCSQTLQTVVTYSITPVVIITGPTGTTVQFQ